MVFLDPQWLTRYVYPVLESEEVIEGDGIFTRAQMVKVWNALDDYLRDHFLRMMEKFDLSTGPWNKERSALSWNGYPSTNLKS